MIINTLVNFQLLKGSFLFMLAFVAVFPAPSQVIDHLAQVKSPFDEQHPVLSPSGELYFTIAFHPENQHGVGDYGDIWLSTSKETMEFQKPSKVKDLSTSGYDVVVGFLSGNSILVYHDGKEKMPGIHQYSGSGNSWKYEKQLNLGSFRNRSELFSGRLSPSRDALILSLDSFGSYGNEDIYVNFLGEDGHWTSPQNLGPQINTYQQELTPSISFDKRVLFFSSNGHGSNGGRDIFYAERLDESWEKWSIPKPLSAGNTEGVELSYFQFPDDPTKAIFTTTQNSEGYGDMLIVQAENIMLPDKEGNQESEERRTGAGSVTANEMEEPVMDKSATAKIENKAVQETPMHPKEIRKEERVSVSTEVEENGKADSSTRSIENEGQTIQLKALDRNTLSEINYEVALLGYSGEKSQKMSSAAYRYTFPIDTGSVKKVIITSAGYLPLTLMVDQVIGLSEPLLLTPASKGVSMVLEQVLFKRGTAELLDSNSMEFISSLADFLMDNPAIKIRLEGHTDNLGNVQLNKKLSLDRASTIRKYLVDRGVEFERIRITGWGGTKPKASNNNEEGRRLNRRVEMVILD